MELLKAENIKKEYDGRIIIEDVSVHLCEDEIVSLLGVSGGGKTTLFQCISGLVTPESGHVYLRDKEITSCPGKISYMLQKDLLLPHKRIIENVALPMIIKRIKRKEAEEKAESYFAEFGLSGTENKYPSQLSGGMRQRAALLRTYLASDGAALLDEPFSALDAITKEKMHEWYLEVMQKIHLATIFITHDIDEAIKLSDRIYVLGGTPGKIIDEIAVTQKKPRCTDFNLTDEFIAYKRRIISDIRQDSKV